MNLHPSSSPKVFKGIALFTPGGDLVYCLDSNKQQHWHLHLCMMLRDVLGLPEPPHFLVPSYTATVDRWLDVETGQLQTVAEAAPAVLRYQPLLNQVFNLGQIEWQAMPVTQSGNDPVMRSAYRGQFPQLWETHDLVAQYFMAAAASFRPSPELPLLGTLQPSPLATPVFRRVVAQPAQPSSQGYVLRLFVSGSSAATERVLQNLHQLLEECLNQPYTLKVIDVTQHPEQAELDQVSATPTLVRVYPHPVRRLVGNLDRAEQLLGMVEQFE